MQNAVPLNHESETLFKKLQELWEHIDSALSGRTLLSNNDLRLVILASVIGATHRIIRAIITQIKNGSVDGIDILVRSLVEGLINVKYIIEDETQMRARAYIVDDLRDRLSSIKRLIPMLEQGTARGMATVTDTDRYRQLQQQLQQERQDLINRYGQENLNWPALEQRARQSGSEELYATAIWLLSLDVHMTARGLDRFMSENNNSVVIELGQDLSRIYLHLRTIYIIYVALLNECNRHFGIPPREEFDKFDFIP